MSFSNWVIQPDNIFRTSPVIPVIQINNLEHAIPLASALFAGGIQVLEVTLRTAKALEAVRLLTQTFPQALIGVGTVLRVEQLHEAMDAGAQFAFSPGQTQDLLQAGRHAQIPFIPGVASISDLMQGLALGYSHFKLFPAAVVGGVPLLRAIHGPFPQAHFCPTGGINGENFREYLALPNVSCVGGSWIVPDEAIRTGNWSLITDLCLSARHCVVG